MPTTLDSANLQSELRDLWRTRPVRTPDDRKVAGVAGGFGRRYGVDPVLVRVAFAATALLGGSGLCLYSLCWLLLRRAGDEVSLGEALIGRGRASGSKLFALVLAVVAFATLPTFGTNESFLVGAGFLGLAAMLAGWFGLHHRTPVPPTGWETVTSPSATASATGPTAGPAPMQAPAWDPLSAAPFAWDLPEPGRGPEPPAPRKPRSRLTKVTLGIALIAVAASVGLAQIADIAWFSAPRIGAIALAVVGVGLLIGSVLRRGHGLLVVAGPLAGFVLLSSLIPSSGTIQGWGRGGDRTVTVTEIAQLGAPLVHEVGTLRVDMSSLDLDRDRTYSISNDVGEVYVRLPKNLDVRVTCATDVGSVDCPQGMDRGADGASGPLLTLDVRSDVGSVEVTR